MIQDIKEMSAALGNKKVRRKRTQISPTKYSKKRLVRQTIEMIEIKLLIC